jgi:segregation and condensation protein B
MSLKSKIEAIIYAAEEPVTVDQIVDVLKDVAPQELAPPAQTQPDVTAAESADAPVVETGHTDENVPAQPADPKATAKAERAAQRARVRAAIEELVAAYDAAERGIEIRAIAGGYRMATKPEHHDAVRTFARSLKSPVRLSLQALETLAVIAYKQPVTVPEISEIRGVDAQGVIGTLLDRKLVTTAGRKQVVGRPILYKTTKDFLLRFGLKDISELPSMEEFEMLATDQRDLFEQPAPAGETRQSSQETPSEAAAEPAHTSE